jgi:hypothetical protein
LEVEMSVSELAVDTPLGVSSYRYPTGWYIAAWSSDIGHGTVKALHYFGRDLVCFRTASGEVSVLDAYCLHLGGNLGVGGRVEVRRSSVPGMGGIGAPMAPTR